MVIFSSVYMTMDDGNGEPIFAATELLSFRVTVKLHAESILTQPESRPTTPESILTKRESVLNRTDLKPESILSREQSILSESKSILSRPDCSDLFERVEAWATSRLLGVRVDGRANMLKVLKVIAVSGEYTQEQMGIACGMSAVGIKKLTAALQKMGLIAHDGRTSGAVWKLVGFKN